MVTIINQNWYVLLRVNGISMLIRIDQLPLSIDIINRGLVDIKFTISHDSFTYESDLLVMSELGQL